jgi:hypothetical protein
MDRRSWLMAVSFASTFAATLLARDARALGPVDIEVTGAVGGGTDPLTTGGPNPLGFGTGWHAGVAFHGLYGGAALVYYFGGSERNGVGGSASDHTLTYGIEAGYELQIVGGLTVRPQVGVGDFVLTFDPGACTLCNITQTNGSSNISSLYLQPGVAALFSLGKWLLGVDASALVLPSITEPYATVATTDVAFTADVQVGARF